MKQVLLTVILMVGLVPCFRAGEPEPATADSPLTVHLARGLWSRFYQLEPALGQLGGAIVSESWHGDKSGSGWLGTGRDGGGWIAWYNGSPEWLAQHHVVILANIPARALKKKQQEALVKYVKDGGALLILGGRYSLGKSYGESALAELIPFSFPGGGFWNTGVTNESSGLQLTPGKDASDDIKQLSWDQSPMIYWYNAAADINPSAKVFLQAGDEAICIGHKAGKGKVVIFRGSVLGVPQEGQLPAWKWRDWPTLFAALIKLAAPEYRTNSSDAAPAKGTADSLMAKAEGLAATGAFKENKYADVLTEAHKAYQQALMDAALAGNEKAVQQLVNALMDNLYLISRARTERNKPSEKRKAARQGVASVHDWNRAIWKQLNTASPVVLTNLASAIASVKDHRVEVIALAVFAGRAIPADASAALQASSVPAVKALSK